MQTDTQSKLSSKTVGLHWIVAVMTMTLLATGIYMEQNEAFEIYSMAQVIGGY